MAPVSNYFHISFFGSWRSLRILIRRNIPDAVINGRSRRNVINSTVSSMRDLSLIVQ